MTIANTPGTNGHGTNGNAHGRTGKNGAVHPDELPDAQAPRNWKGGASNGANRVSEIIRNGLSNRFVPARYAHIVGWGMDVPKTVITNADLEAVVDTTDDWIRTRTGIHERRFASDRESVTTLGFQAAVEALKVANILPIELELIIVATSTPENFYPSTASKIQNLLGTTKCGAFDLSAACSGFVYALNMAAQAIRSGSINIALVIGSETNSRILDWEDRGTCILFGDGAGAVVLRGSDEPGGILSCVLGSDGTGADLLGVPTVGAAAIPDGQLLHKVHMDGREVFRFATHILNESIREVTQKAGIDLEDVALIVPHQANQRILAAAARSLGVPESLFYSNIHKYGNTSAASIPIALCEAIKDGRLKDDDHVVFVGFGGGLTWGAMVLQWQSSKPSKGFAATVNDVRLNALLAYAVWRDRFMKNYRKVEANLLGPTTGRRGRKSRQRQDERDKR